MGSPSNIAPIIATEDVAPVANTTAGRYTFQRHVRHVIFGNDSTQPAYLYINKTDADPTAAAYHVLVPAGAVVNLSGGPREVNIKSVRIWWPTGASPMTRQIAGWE